MFNIDYVPSRVFNIDYAYSRVFTVDFVTSLGVLDYVPSGVFNIDYVLRFFLSTQFQVDLLGNHLQSDVSEFQEMLFYINQCSDGTRG